MEPSTNLTTEKARRDYRLVCQAREHNDQKAYADLMGMYREPLYTMLLKMTNNPVDADDLTIETFSKAFTSLHLYSPTNAFSTWLFSIASNHCIDFIRKKRMQTVSINDVATGVDGDVYEYPLPSDLPSPEESMVSQERKALLHDVVQQIKPRYRRLIEMRYFEELSYEEIAQQLNMPMGTVKVQLLRARNLLTSMMKNHKEQI